MAGNSRRLTNFVPSVTDSLKLPKYSEDHNLFQQNNRIRHASKVIYERNRTTGKVKKKYEGGNFYTVAKEGVIKARPERLLFGSSAYSFFCFMLFKGENIMKINYNYSTEPSTS